MNNNSYRYKGYVSTSRASLAELTALADEACLMLFRHDTGQAAETADGHSGGPLDGAAPGALPAREARDLLRDIRGRISSILSGPRAASIPLRERAGAAGALRAIALELPLDPPSGWEDAALAIIAEARSAGPGADPEDSRAADLLALALLDDVLLDPDGLAEELTPKAAGTRDGSAQAEEEKGGRK